MTPEIVIASTFFDAQRKLDSTQLQGTIEALRKLEGGGVEQVRLHDLTASSLCSFDVSKGAMRVICHKDGPVLALLHVDTHDKAYAWARRHKVLRIGKLVRLGRVRLEEDEGPVSVEPAAAPGPGPLSSVKAKDLARIGFGLDLSEFLRSIPDEDILLGLAAVMSPHLGEAIVSLAAEPERLDVILRQLEAAPEADSSPSAAYDDPANAEHFWAPRPGEEGLARALEGAFEKWQVFLHPSQKRVVEMSASGPVKLTGGPGTGKTVVALHRARYLAEHVFADDPRPILVTAFSRSLVTELERAFAQLVSDRPELLERVRFRTTSRLAMEVLEAAERPHQLLGDKALDEAWDHALEGESLGLDRAFHASEREEVLMARGTFDERSYLRVPRPGRGKRLGARERRQVFEVLCRFDEALDAQGGADDAGLAQRATAVVPDPSPYAAVVVDELQDAHPSSLRLLHALAGEGPNRLFLAGDGYQRIFRRPIPLSWTGISVVGRSRHLNLNYRTTSGIRDAAVELMLGEGVDVLDSEDGGADETVKVRKTPDSVRSMRPGPRPEHVSFPDPAAALDALAKLAQPGAEERVLILVPSKIALEVVSDGLEARGLAHQRLHEADVPFALDGPPVGLCTFHRAKGLEASHVILWDPPGPRRPAGLEPDEWARRQRSLRYVALTRARDRCTLLKVPS